MNNPYIGLLSKWNMYYSILLCEIIAWKTSSVWRTAWSFFRYEILPRWLDKRWPQGRVQLRKDMWVGWLIKNNDLKRNSIMSQSTFSVSEHATHGWTHSYAAQSCKTQSSSAEAHPANKNLLETRKESQGHKYKWC